MKLLLLLLLAAPAFSYCQVCISYAEKHNAISRNTIPASDIVGLRIENPSGPCIRLKNINNLTISNCILGPSSEEGIELENCRNITIINNIFKCNQGGVFARGCENIKILNNQFINAMGPGPRGQFVQFDTCTGGGQEISNNVGENIPDRSHPEDLINLYKTHGLSGSPILIKKNKFRGGGPSGSGGGILAGDERSSWATIDSNILVDPGQYGISIAGGTNNKILNNKVYGRQQHFTNIGIYVWNQYAPPCNGHQVEYNESYFVDSNGILKPGWDGTMADGTNACGTVTGWNNNTWNAPITESILPDRLLCPELATYYPFNMNWTDQTGSDHTAGHMGSVFACDGNAYSAYFDGINDQLVLPHSNWLRPALEQFTLSAWINPSNVTGIKGIVHSQDGDGWNDGWRLLLIDSNLNARVVTPAGAVDIYCAGIKANQWNHIVVTYDRKQLTGYVNGTLAATTAAIGNIVYRSTSDVNMRIGVCPGDYYFSGKIDEFKFYNGVMLQSEIAADYNAWKELMGPCAL